MRTLHLEEREQVDMLLSFTTMVCEIFQELTLKNPETLWQAYYCGMERFCRRYASRYEIIELLDVSRMEVLAMLTRRFFSVEEKAEGIPQRVREMFSQDLQNLVFHLPKARVR